MAVTQTPRFQLPQWSAGTDQHPARTGWNAILKTLEDKAAIVFPSGTIANRPTAGTFGRFYMATDQGATGRLYYDGGSGWVELNTNGGGGIGAPVVIENAATEGTSNRSARADHTHRIPLATATVHGAMASQDKALLDTTSATATASSLVRRTNTGNVVVPATPGGPNDAASKSYVDGNAASGSLTAQPNTLMLRGSTGTSHVKTGTNQDDATNIAWVNAALNAQQHDGSDITSGTIHHARITGSLTGYNITTGTGSSVFFDGNSNFRRYTSTKRHKTNIREWDKDPRELLKVVASIYDRIDPQTGKITNTDEVGVIAEWANQSVPEFTEWGPDTLDEDGNPETETLIQGWTYVRWTAAHQHLHRWNTGRVDATVEAVKRIAEQTGVDLSDLIPKMEG